jgi:hypothetical protein
MVGLNLAAAGITKTIIIAVTVKKYVEVEVKVHAF